MIDKELKHLGAKASCPRCNSRKVNYEANDKTQIISFVCEDCQWTKSTSYGMARQHNLEPTGAMHSLTITLLNEQGEVASETTKTWKARNREIELFSS